MLTIPIFRPWRAIWDVQLATDETLRLDELAKQRQTGRQIPPPVHDWSDVNQVLHAIHMAQGRIPTVRFVQEKIEPLLKACVWPRWLLLEEALDQAARSGDLHLSALILRSQIEELDALRTAATVLSHLEEGSWDTDAMADTIQTLTRRVLPRLQPKIDEQLLERASEAGTENARAEPLQQAYERLSEYVHPNYGSHVLSVRPHGVEVAKVLIHAFVVVYEAFLSLPWARDAVDSREVRNQQGQTDPRNPYHVLADDTIPALRHEYAGSEENRWNDVAECFRQQASREDNWAELNGLPIDVEAIHALRVNSVPSSSWPEAIQTVAGQNRYAFLVMQEHRLASDAARIVAGAGEPEDTQRLAVIVSGLTFAITVTEYKLDSLATQAARLINAENVLGAAIAVRSMLEHHAVAIELGEKLKVLWERAVKGAPNAPEVADAFVGAEKQIARVLAGSSQPSEASPWRVLWQEAVRKPYNVLGPVRALDATQPGMLRSYGLLSHMIHGTVGTGGDLLGAGGERWRAGHRPLTAVVTRFLANVCEFDAMLDRQAASLTIGRRLYAVRDADHAPERIKQMRLTKGQKLKLGRDINGSGTRDDPYRFREGLLYHDAYYQYLAQEGVEVRARTCELFVGGLGDRVEAVDGRVLCFLNDKGPVQ